MTSIKELLLAGTLLLTLVTGCSQPMTELPAAPTAATAIPTNTEVPPAETVAAQSVSSDAERITAPEVSAGDLAELTSGNATFAVALYHALAGNDGNLFCSPHSISTALAMTYAGARGETATQLAETLHFTLPQEQLHPTFNALDQRLQPQEPSEENPTPFTLKIANSLWGEQSYTFLTEFLALLAQNYGAGLQLVDFKHAPEETRQAINGWVSANTEEKIQDLIPQGVINPDTRLVLANAIYFYAGWLHTFDENLTADAPFTLLDGEEISVPLMHLAKPAQLNYARGDSYQAVELPYAGRQTSMVLIMPATGEFHGFEEQLSAEQLANIIEKLEYQSVNLALPKFGYQSTLNLTETLRKMGMPLAMSGGADFSGMDGEGNLAIGAVLHQACVEVDEQGTEAAAATAVVMMLTSMPGESFNFTVDQPFIYLIRDTQTGAILFVGRVVDPSA
ncbi:MAG: serpin family protein [Chloroflexota bacterium]|nr:serpin family protein [Chloroflexota bacterium]